MKTQKGITLIALIITIIVMLILVGVSVSVALNTGLFESAQSAASNTEAEKIKETALSNGSVTVKVGDEEKTFESMEKYIESLKGEKEEGIKLAATPTHKFYFDNEVFLIDENTTWDEVILTFDENRYVGDTGTWKAMIDRGEVPSYLRIQIVDGDDWPIFAEPAGARDPYGEDGLPWSHDIFRGTTSIPKILETAPDTTWRWFAGSPMTADAGLATLDEAYENRWFEIKLEEI